MPLLGHLLWIALGASLAANVVLGLYVGWLAEAVADLERRYRGRR